MRTDFPIYLLDHILLHLPLLDLLSARRVCKDWNVTILSRQRLRRRLFLQPPTVDADHLRQPVAMHPVLQRLQSNWASIVEPIILTQAPVSQPLPACECIHSASAPLEADSPGDDDEEDEEGGKGAQDGGVAEQSPKTKMRRRRRRRKATGTRLEDSPVKDQYATEPALTTFAIALPTYHLLVVRPLGVCVWDVAMGVKTLFGRVSRGRTDGFGEIWSVLPPPPSLPPSHSGPRRTPAY